MTTDRLLTPHEAKAQVPADGKHDHIRREAETGEGRPCNRIGPDAASSHDTSLAARARSQQMQQSLSRSPPARSASSRSAMADLSRAIVADSLV
jgi:hypothetical protein